MKIAFGLVKHRHFTHLALGGALECNGLVRPGNFRLV
jgi:hypothetical protein